MARVFTKIRFVKFIENVCVAFHHYDVIQYDFETVSTGTDNFKPHQVFSLFSDDRNEFTV